MKKLITLIYGVGCYALFLGTFLYAMGFMCNLGVPKSIDSTPANSWAVATLVNLSLLGLFAVQHSVMARPWFKGWWTRFVPAPAERSTYVLFSSVALLLLFAFWQPMGSLIWKVENAVARTTLHALGAFGWLLVLVTTFLINHFDLFGLRQVWLHFRGREYTALRFVTPGPYRVVRHPLYVGWICAFWGTPTMTVAHLFFAVATTTYILLAIRWEERDLVAHHGRNYADYQRNVPMIVPGRPKARPNAVQLPATATLTVPRGGPFKASFRASAHLDRQRP
jgi:methanethiol S-methyltransferase